FQDTYWPDLQPRSGMGFMVRLAGAAAIAAVLALVVVGQLPPSWTAAAIKQAGDPAHLLTRSAELTPRPNVAAERSKPQLPQLIMAPETPRAPGQSLRFNAALS